MEKSSLLCQLFFLISVLVCVFLPSFVSAVNEVNLRGTGAARLITLPRRPNIFQKETPQLGSEEDRVSTQNSTGVGSVDGLEFLYHEVLDLVEGVINKIF